MATTNQLVTRIKRRLSRGNDTGSDASIIDELAAAQERLENGKTLPYQLLFASTTNVAAAHSEFSLPVGFIKFAVDDPLRVQDTTIVDPLLAFVQMTVEDHDLLESRKLGTAADAFTLPTHAELYGLTLQIRPGQPVGRDYRLRYYRRDPTLPVAGNSTIWTTNLPDLLVGEAGLILAETLRDKAALDLFAAIRSRAYGELVATEAALEDSRGSKTMGD